MSDSINKSDYECTGCERQQGRNISEQLVTQCGWEKRADDSWLCPFCSKNEDKLRAIFAQALDNDPHGSKPFHVYPKDDLRDHKTDGQTCWCQPQLEEDGAVIIHNSMDRREEYEQGRKPS